MRRAWAAAGFAVVALAGCGGEAAEGDSESARSTTTEAAAIQTLPWPAPSMADLLGKWSQEERRVVAWF
jgi:ABC-type glycerol-3-phosphate transport system substrate-binding protein